MIHLENDSKFRYIALLSLWERKDHWRTTHGSMVRGFIPTTTHSIHRIYDPRFVPAIANFCAQDREHMAQYRQQAFEALPFNADNMPAFDNNQ